MAHHNGQVRARVRAFPKRLALFGIRLYRTVGAPWLGGACRFTPSCSTYALEAVERHGAVRGMGLAFHRLLRCRPFYRGAAYDPVPGSRSAREPLS